MAGEKTVSIYRWIRILHRDIGFLLVGMTVIYAVSGFVLTYRDADIFKTEIHEEKAISPGLAVSELGWALPFRGQFTVLDEDETTIRFVGGSYNKESGIVSYVRKDFLPVIKQFNNLHFVSSRDTRHWFTATYAVLLLFLALSSFWMYKPGTKMFRRAVVLSVLGGVLAVVLVLC